MVKSLSKNRNNAYDQLAVYVIFMYWIIYENILFFNSAQVGDWFEVITNSLKVLIPLWLIAYIGINVRLLVLRNSFYYLLFFILFVFWVGLVTLFNGELIEWYKLIPRIVYYYAVLSIFYKSPDSIYLFGKLMVAYVVLALLQYTGTYATGAWRNPTNDFGYDSSGLLGLYSNISSMMYFPEISVPIIRLTGFWNEPSNASGSAFAAFFLSKFIHTKEQVKKWEYASYACLMAGFLSISNAGYFAFGVALLVGVSADNKMYSNKMNVINMAIVSTLSIFAVWLALFGRSFVKSSNYSESVILRAVVGLRELDDDSDVYGGRIDLVVNTLSYLNENVLGSGLRAIDNMNNVMVSASAIVYWLLIGGVIGVTLLICRELVLLRASWRLIKRSKSNIYLVQALAAVMAQHLSYGSWMNPNYLILAAAVLALSLHERRTATPLLTMD